MFHEQDNAQSQRVADSGTGVGCQVGAKAGQSAELGNPGGLRGCGGGGPVPLRTADCRRTGCDRPLVNNTPQGGENSLELILLRSFPFLPCEIKFY